MHSILKKKYLDKTAQTFIDPHNSTNMKKLSIISVHTNLFVQNEGSNDKIHVHGLGLRSIGQSRENRRQVLIS